MFLGVLGESFRRDVLGQHVLQNVSFQKYSYFQKCFFFSIKIDILRLGWQILKDFRLDILRKTSLQ